VRHALWVWAKQCNTIIPSPVSWPLTKSCHRHDS